MNTPFTTTFRKLFMLPVILILLTMAGCGDDDGGSTTPAKKGTLICKINGSERKFNFMVSANDKPAEAVVHFVTISGNEEDDFKSPGFGFQLVSDEGAAVGTYSTTGSNLHGNYYVQNLDSAGNIVSTTSYYGDGSSATSFTMTITTLNSWGVEGTFSGVLKLNGGEEFLTVTDGVFSAPYNGN